MSDWFDAEEKMTAEVVDEFGGRRLCQYVPTRRSPNRRTAEDPTRPKFDILGVFDWPWERAVVHPTEAIESSRGPSFFTNAGCLQGRNVQANDIVRIPYRGEVLQFEIIDIRRDGESGVWFDLQQLGTQV